MPDDAVTEDTSSETAGDDARMSVQTGLCLEIEIAALSAAEDDSEALINRAARVALDMALTGPMPPMELFVKLVNDAEIQLLNQQYRSKNHATNILSFPGVEPDDLPDTMKLAAQGGPPVLLGDLIIASAIVRTEAVEQSKSVGDHLSHLTVHGVLHLLGYDHINDIDAEEMEGLEREILAQLSIADPYEADE